MARQTGKTTILIILSHFTKARIITPTICNADYVEQMADKMNLSIPKPMGCYDYISSHQKNPNEKILIDELDFVLKQIFKYQ